MTAPTEYPMQPIVIDGRGQPRFKSNPILIWLVNTKKIDLNEVARYCAMNDMPDWAQEQLAQLIGYSVSGFSELSYVRDSTYEEAVRLAEQAKEAP